MSANLPFQTPASQLFRGDVLDVLPTLPADSVALVLTSPPFNCVWDYGDGGAGDLQPITDYLGFLQRVLGELARVLRPGGLLAMNLPASIKVQPAPDAVGQAVHRVCPIKSLIEAWLWQHGAELGWSLCSHQVWAKSRPGATIYATGNRMGNHVAPHPRYVHELFVMASKGPLRVAEREARWPGDTDNFGAYRETLKDVWWLEDDEEGTAFFIGPGRAKRGEPLAFPRELVCRFIELYSNPGDVVLDPFAGSGAVGRVALDLDRRAWLIEREPRYWARLEAVLGQAVMMVTRPPSRTRLSDVRNNLDH
jgi:adenine-specific DNA-methyltransferase